MVLNLMCYLNCGQRRNYAPQGLKSALILQHLRHD